MVIKIFVGPKEKEYYKKIAELNGWDPEDPNDVTTAIVEYVDVNFFDKIQCPPNGIEFTDTDENFDEENALENLKFMS